MTAPASQFGHPDLVVGPSWRVRAAAVVAPAIFIAFVVAIIRYPRYEHVEFLWSGAVLALAITIVACLAQRMRLSATHSGFHFRGPLSQTFHPWSTLTVARVRRDVNSGVAREITINYPGGAYSFARTEFDASFAQGVEQVLKYVPQISAAPMQSSVYNMSQRWLIILLCGGLGSSIVFRRFGGGAWEIFDILTTLVFIAVVVHLLRRDIIGLTIDQSGVIIETILSRKRIPWDRLVVHRFEQSGISEPITLLHFGDGSKMFYLDETLTDPGYQSIAKAILERSGMHPLADPSPQPTAPLSQ